MSSLLFFPIEVNAVSIISPLEDSTAQWTYPGIRDVLNSRNLPPFVKYEDPTCHQNRLHILDITCFLLRVPRMSSVHR